jgi:hypothetical protein
MHFFTGAIHIDAGGSFEGDFRAEADVPSACCVSLH